MVSEKQRRRALARAKHERQQARRTSAAERGRTTRTIAGVVVGVVLVGLVGWGVYHLATSGSDTPETPVNTFPNTLTMKTPTNTSFVTSFSSAPPTTANTPKTSPTGTTPETTGSTGKATP